MQNHNNDKSELTLLNQGKFKGNRKEKEEQSIVGIKISNDDLPFDLYTKLEDASKCFLLIQSDSS